MNIPAPLTENQHAYLDRCAKSWLNVAEGGKRGGKNVLQTLAFCTYLDVHPNRIHLIAGVSTATARINIIDCDGFGMLNFFEGRCHTGQYQNRDCLYVDTNNGRKIVLISGGGKDRDERLIKGNTYGMAYITEANECHPNFIREVFDRTMSSANRKVFHDLNPKAPKHWYYSDVLSFHESRQRDNPSYGYNYGHFTIADNMSIPDDQMRRVLDTYDKGSVWYQRDILGKRAAAEGLVYRTFANTPDRYIIDSADTHLKETGQTVGAVMIGVDFGGTRSATTMKAVLITRGAGEVIVAHEKHIRSEIDPQQLSREYAEFVREVTARWGMSQTRADSAEQILIRGLYGMVLREKLRTEVKNAIKRPIIDRIRLTNLLFAQDRIKICKGCRHMIEAFADAVYDEKHEDERLDNGTSDIDSLDAFEYCIEPHIAALEAAGYRKGTRV